MVASTMYELHATFGGTIAAPASRKSLALSAFSVYTNGQKLFDRRPTTGNGDQLSCVHGIRVLSIVWVVLGHSYMMMALGPLTNALEIVTWIRSLRSMFLLSATVSVDTFFLMSGVLVGRSLLSYLDQHGGRLPVVHYLVHRYIRLTSSLAAAVLACMTLLSRIGDGPLWEMFMPVASEPCRRWWWTTLLYVQNYANPGQMCMSHSWYLSVDMQLYVLAPVLVWPLWRCRSGVGAKAARWLAVAVIGALVAMSAASVFAVWMTNGFSGRLAVNM